MLFWNKLGKFACVLIVLMGHIYFVCEHLLKLHIRPANLLQHCVVCRKTNLYSGNLSMLKSAVSVPGHWQECKLDDNKQKFAPRCFTGALCSSFNRSICPYTADWWQHLLPSPRSCILPFAMPRPQHRMCTHMTTAIVPWLLILKIL